MLRPFVAYKFILDFWISMRDKINSLNVYSAAFSELQTASQSQKIRVVYGNEIADPFVAHMQPLVPNQVTDHPHLGHHRDTVVSCNC